MYTKEDNRIIFSRPTEELFDAVAMRSAYTARNIRDKEGNQLVDDYSITSDDKAVLGELLADVVTDLRATLVKLLPPGENNIIIGNENISVRMTDNKHYNENVLPAVDDCLKEVIVNGALLGWYKLHMYDALVQIMAQTYQNSLIKLNEVTFQLMKKI